MTAAGVLWWVCIAAEVGALAAAVRLALTTSSRAGNFPRSWQQIASFPRRVAASSSAPLVAILVFVLVADLAIKAGQTWLFTDPDHPLREAIARIGWPARAWYHLETGLVAGWPLAVAWASGRVFGPENRSPARDFTATVRRDSGHSTDAGDAALPPYARRSNPATSYRGGENLRPRERPVNAIDLLAGLFLGLVIGMAASYPLRPGLTRWLLWAWEAVCVAAAWAGVARGWPGRGGAVEKAAIVFVACETMVTTCGPFLSDPFTRWWIATAFYLAAFAGVGVVLGRARRPGVS